MLLTVLQLFDEIPKCHIAVWNVITGRYMNNEMENVTFDLSRGLIFICIAPGRYMVFNILLLCSLEFFNFGRHDHVVVNSPVIISILMNGKCAQRDLRKNLLAKNIWLSINWGMRKLFGKAACSHFDEDCLFNGAGGSTILHFFLIPYNGCLVLKITTCKLRCTYTSD